MAPRIGRKSTPATASGWQLFPPLSQAEYDALKADIAGQGQQLPIIEDQDGNVIDGFHRLRACEELGLDPFVEVRQFKDDAERKAVAIALNLKRRHLDPIVWGRMFKELAKVEGKRSVGRPKKGDSPISTNKLAKELGVDPKTARERVAAADTIDAYPFMAGWKPYRVMEAREHLESLPEDTRETMAEMLAEPMIPPKTGISMLANVASKPRKEQREITKLYASADERDRTLAKTKAVELPPMPDERRIELIQIERALKSCIKRYPDDALVPDFEALVGEVQRLQKAIEQQEAKRNG